MTLTCGGIDGVFAIGVVADDDGGVTVNDVLLDDGGDTVDGVLPDGAVLGEIEAVGEQVGVDGPVYPLLELPLGEMPPVLE